MNEPDVPSFLDKQSQRSRQADLSVSDDPLGPVFDQLPLNIRYDVYLRQRAVVPGTPDWETRNMALETERSRRLRLYSTKGTR